MTTLHAGPSLDMLATSDRVADERITMSALVPFLAIAFGLAWGIIALYLFAPDRMAATFGEISGNHPLFFLAVYAPAIAAVSIVGFRTGARGLGGFFSRLTLWRCPRPWYLFLLLVIPIVYFGGAALAGKPPAQWLPAGSLGTLAGALALASIKGPVEELGWRGLALPLLQRRLAPFWAGLVLGIIWGVWHLPAFLLSGTPQSAWSFAPFFAGSVAVSVIVTSLFNVSRGSILLPMLLHFQTQQPVVARCSAVRHGPVHCGRSGRGLARSPRDVHARFRDHSSRRAMSGARALASVLLIASVACRPAAAPATAASADLEARFQAELDGLRARFGFPGATAAFSLPDGTVGAAATGLADVELRTPMTPRSRMLAASIGKSFVAATAIALAREGRVDLDAPIQAWLSDRPWLARLPNHDSITLRHLLTHAAGLPDHVHTPEFARAMAQAWRAPANPFPPERLIQFVLDRPALFPSGHGWSYSDTGYILAGLIIERAARRSYHAEVRERFLVPLRLDATSPSDRAELAGLASGYTAESNALGLPAKTTIAPGVMAWNPAVEWTGGGLVTTPRDLVVWARALYEGRAMTGRYLDDLLRSVPIGEQGSGLRYGAGVAIYLSTPLGPSYGHGGTIPGYSSSMRYYPEHRVAVAFQINTDVGLTDGAAPVISEVERRLAEIVVNAR